MLRLDWSRVSVIFCFWASKSAGLGSTLSEKLVGNPRRTHVNGATDISLLERESRDEKLGAAEASNIAVASEEFGGFGVQAEGFGGGIELFAGFDALDKVVDLGLRQLHRLAEAKFGDDLVANLVKRAGVSRKSLLERENDVAAVGANGKAQFVRAKADDGRL